MVYYYDHFHYDRYDYAIVREGDIPEAVLKAFLAVDNELRRWSWANGSDDHDYDHDGHVDDHDGHVDDDEDEEEQGWWGWLANDGKDVLWYGNVRSYDNNLICPTLIW